MKILFFLFLCACCFSCTSNQKKDSEKNKQDKNHLLLGNHVITIMNKEFTHENPIDSISVEKILFLGYKIVNRVPSKNSYTENYDTLVTCKKGSSKFVFLKLKEKDLLLNFELTDRNFLFGNFLRIGLNSKSFFTRMGAENSLPESGGLVKLVDEETDSFTEILFEKDSIIKISTSWYYD